MIGFKLTDLSFDGNAILEKVQKAEQKALRIVGFQTRQRALQSIQPGAGPSAPGSPPRDQVGTLKRFILYQIDKETNSVVIGPKYLKRKSKHAPAALEKGGVSLTVKQRPIRIEKRPYMTPAFEAIKRQQVPAIFSNSLR